MYPKSPRIPAKEKPPRRGTIRKGKIYIYLSLQYVKSMDYNVPVFSSPSSTLCEIYHVIWVSFQLTKNSSILTHAETGRICKQKKKGHWLFCRRAQRWNAGELAKCRSPPVYFRGVNQMLVLSAVRCVDSHWEIYRRDLMKVSSYISAR